MNLMTINEKGWATFTQQGSLTVVSLFSESSQMQKDIDASTLNHICGNIMTLDTDNPRNDPRSIHLDIIDGKNHTFKISWGKHSCRFNTIAFLTQAAPQFLATYRLVAST